MGGGALIVVNGRFRAAPPGGTVGDLLRELGLSPAWTVAAVNGEAVGRGALDGRRLADGDRVDLVQATAGG